MKKIDVLKGIQDVGVFADLIVLFVNEYKTPDEIKNELVRELTEEQLRTIKSVAETDYPLSFVGKQ